MKTYVHYVFRLKTTSDNALIIILFIVCTTYTIFLLSKVIIIFELYYYFTKSIIFNDNIDIRSVIIVFIETVLTENIYPW